MYLLDDDNVLVDSEFSLDVLDGSPCLIVESRGGASRLRGATRNPDYNKLLGLLLQRLAAASTRITAVVLDSRRVKYKAISKRLATLESPYPIDLSVLDINDFRRSLSRAIARTCRAQHLTSGGSPQKRIRICLDRPVEPKQLLTLQTAMLLHDSSPTPGRVVAHTDPEITERIRADYAPGLTETEKEYILNARLGQGQFRDLLLDAYGSTCPILGIANADLLIASHIKPWTVCTNHERLDPKNGILLSALFDRLFDRGLITFDVDGTIRSSPCLSPNDRAKCYLDQTARIELSPESHRYMEYHRGCVFNRIGQKVQ